MKLKVGNRLGVVNELKIIIAASIYYTLCRINRPFVMLIPSW